MPTFALEVEYAKSGRAACKQCKEKIDKDAVRIGFKTEAPEAAADEESGGAAAPFPEGVKWHHCGCLPRARGHPWFKKHFPGEAAGTVAGFDCLKEADQGLVTALLKACRGDGPMPETAAPAAGATETPEKEKAAASKRKGKSKAGADGEPPAKVAKVAVVTLTSEQVDAIAAAKTALASKNVAMLGAMLAKNGLPKAGKKEEVLERVAECKALGVPPTCTTCEKVKLRFSKEAGKFSCPGFFDADDKRFKRCKGPGDGADLQRTPWQELA